MSDQEDKRRLYLNSLYYSQTHRRRKRDDVREELLTEWYGEGLAEREIEHKQAPNSALGSLLKPMMDALNVGENAMMRDLMDSWAALVGEQIAKSCEPRRLQGDQLIVEVHNSVMRFQLEAHRRDLEAKVERFTGGKIKRLRLQAGGATPRWGRKGTPPK